MTYRLNKYFKGGNLIYHNLIEYFDHQRFTKYFSLLYIKMLKLDFSKSQTDCKFSRAFKDIGDYLEIKEDEIDFDRFSNTSSLSFAPSCFNAAPGTACGDRLSEKSSVTARAKPHLNDIMSFKSAHSEHEGLRLP